VLKKRWTEFYDSGFNGLDIDTFIDEFVERIRPAYETDVVRWPDNGIDNQKRDFSRYIHAKIDWLNTQWNNNNQENDSIN
jgi:hypothetical protein